jgi:hypothetical protein
MKTTLYILSALLTLWFVASSFINQKIDDFVMNLGIYSASIFAIFAIYIIVESKEK